MKHMISLLAVCGLLVTASGGAFAEDEHREASSSMPVLFNPDAPHILNDMACTSFCQPAKLSCNPATAQQTGGRCS